MNLPLKGSLGFGLALLLGSVLISQGEVAAKENVLTIGDPTPVNNLDAAQAQISQNTMLTRNIFQGLLRYKFNSMELEGDLAKSWSVSKDGLVYTFKLRDNILWHKAFGKVTAHDVKFSWDRVMDPQTKSPFRGELVEEVKDIKVIDDYTVEIRLKRRSSVFLHKCARPRPAGIVSQKAVEKYGKDFAYNPIGSGPFVFQSMSREQVVLTANKEYFEGPPKIDRVIYKAIPDMDTLIMAMLKGDIDLLWIAPRDKVILDRFKGPDFKVERIEKGTWQWLLLNSQFKPFADVRVRRAIAHAIDRDAIIQYVLSGMAEKLDSLVPKGYFGHTEEGVRPYDFNPQKAKELLSEAGYPNGFEVILDTFNSPSYLPVVIALQDQLGKVGIRIKLDVSDQPVWLKKLTSATTNFSLFFPIRSPDADIPLTNFFHSAGFSPGVNIMRYNKLDREIDMARSEMDPAKRQKMYGEIQKRLMEDLPGIPLFMVQFPAPHRADLIGFPERDSVWGFDFYRLHYLDKQ